MESRTDAGDSARAARWLLASLCVLLALTSCKYGTPFAGDWRELRRGQDGKKWGYIDRSGKFVIRPRFDDVSNFSEGLARAARKGKGHGFIDKTGAWVIKPRFSLAWDFAEGLAAVMDRTDKWGYVDSAGRMVIPPRFDSAQNFSEGLAAVRVDDADKHSWGYIDKTGKFVLPPKFRDSSSFLYGKSRFSEGIAVIEIAGMFDLIDRRGNVITSMRAYEVRPFHDGRALVRMPPDDKCQSNVFGFLDRTGGFAFPARFCAANDFSDGLAAAGQDGRYGYIDTRGDFVIPPRFDVANDFSEGLAAVKRDSHRDSWIYIDKAGRAVIRGVGDGRADGFHGGLAALDLHSRGGYLKKGAQWGYIDRTGRVVRVFTRATSQTY